MLNNPLLYTFNSFHYLLAQVSTNFVNFIVSPNTLKKHPTLDFCLDRTEIRLAMFTFSHHNINILITHLLPAPVATHLASIQEAWFVSLPRCLAVVHSFFKTNVRTAF